MLVTRARISGYKDILWLVVKYGNADLVKQSEIRSELGDSDPSQYGTGKPEELARDLEKLGPTFVKLGQMLSTRSDLLPSAYVQALARLQDDVEPATLDEIMGVVRAELGQEIDGVFCEFDPAPIACASLGQVHRASMRDGRQVAVKVQRPGVVDQIEKDIAALRDVAVTFETMTEVAKRYRFSRIIDNLESNLARELDYRNEASYSETFRENLSQFDHILVPQVIDEISTRRLLIMDYVAGQKITELSRRELKQVDREELAEQLFRAYLHQVLVDGFFHADPHPGNLILTSDHKIALLDFGMVARISPQARNKLMKLLTNISEGRGDQAAKIALSLGLPTDEFNPDEFKERIARVVNRNLDVPVEQLKAGRIVMEIQRIAAECGMLPTDDTTMLGKALLNLDRVIEALHPGFDPNAAMRDACADLMRERTGSHLSWAQLYNAAVDTTNLIQDLPDRLNKITELVAENRLQVKLDAIDERRLMKGMQKIANRITIGIILAALIVGASLMMRLETSFTMFGYPAVAMAFFLTAAIAGLTLVFRIMFSDES